MDATKVKTKPGEAARALANFGRSVDRLAWLLTGGDRAVATEVLDGLLPLGPAAAVGLLGIALDRAKQDAALRGRLVRLVGVIGRHPEARRAAVAVLSDALRFEEDHAAAIEAAAAFSGLKPRPAELMESLAAAGAPPGGTLG